MKNIYIFWRSLYLILLICVYHILPAQTQFSYNGGPFTPTGDLKILIIFAGLQSECGLDDPFWPQNASGFSSCKTFMPGYDQLFYNDYSQFSSTATDNTLSNFLYQSSRHHPTRAPFRIVADVFPERINVSSKSPGLVYQYINQNYPNFNWGQYDNRTNKPNFISDNSASSPDHKIDYVILVWRINGNTQSVSGEADIGGGTMITNYSGTTEQYTISDGFTANTVRFHLPGIKAMILHEIAHTLYNAPHYSGANGTFGDYFNGSPCWGFMNHGTMVGTTNAWESWYLGWIELPKYTGYNSAGRDLDSYTQNGTYVLQDFATTGDAMRIKLPFSNQRLWLENHAFKSFLDDRTSYILNGYNDSIPPPNPGIFMYVENLTDSRATILQALNSQYTNGIKVMHTGGNYDYSVNSYNTSDPVMWGGVVVDFHKENPNPTGPSNDAARIRDNYAFETAYPNLIAVNPYTNNPGQSVPSCYNIATGTLNEAYSVIRQDENLTYGGLGNDMAFGGDGIWNREIGLSSNPVIVNHQKYDACNQQLEPIYLHGVSVKIISKNSTTGDITVEVKFDNTDIVNDQRFTGNLIVNDVINATYDINVEPGVTLTLNKSGSPNRHTLLNGDFVNLTTFSIANGAYMNMSNDSKVITDESKFTIESGGTLELQPNANLLATNESLIHVKTGATLILQENSKIEAINNSDICIESGANIIFNDPSASIVIDGVAYYGSITSTPGTALIISNTVIPAGVNYHSSIATNNNAYFTTGSSVLRTTTSVEFGPTTSIAPGSGSSLLAYVNAGSFTSNCSNINNYKMAFFKEDNYIASSNDIICEGYNIAETEYPDDQSGSYTASIKAFPNPTQGLVRLETENAFDIDTKSIRLYNSYGMEVFPVVINSDSQNQVFIDISNLKLGVYLIKMNVNGDPVESKIIKSEN